MAVDVVSRGLAAFVLVGGLSLGLSGSAAAERLDTAIRGYQSGYYQEALPVFAEMAAAGSPRGQFWYGTMFYQGRGRPHNFREAMAWYRRAAAQGDADAQANLGLMYRNGEGCVASRVVAFAWLSLAAAQNNEVARLAFDDLKETMSPDLILQGQQMSEEIAGRAEAARSVAAATGLPRRPSPVSPTPPPVAPTPVAPVATSAPAEGYRVQIGLFRNRENVATVSRRLEGERIAVHTDVVTIRGASYTRVRTDVLSSAEAARRMAQRLDALLGIESAVIPLRP